MAEGTILDVAGGTTLDVAGDKGCGWEQWLGIKDVAGNSGWG